MVHVSRRRLRFANGIQIHQPRADGSRVTDEDCQPRGSRPQSLTALKALHPFRAPRLQLVRSCAVSCSLPAQPLLRRANAGLNAATVLRLFDRAALLVVVPRSTLATQHRRHTGDPIRYPLIPTMGAFPHLNNSSIALKFIPEAKIYAPT